MVLDSVLSEGSVARAARRLHVTPSAVSNALARLRHALGDPLVVRKGRGIVPTPRAAGLAPSLRHALSQIERLVEKDAFDPATTTMQFTLAMADVGQIARLPRLASLFAREMPRARLRIVGIDTYVSSGGLNGMEVDAAIVGVAEKAPGIHIMPLYEENSVLVARKGRLRSGRPITKRQLSELRHVEVQVAPGRGYRELALSYARLGIDRQIAVVVPGFIAAASVVASTDFVATLPADLIGVLGEGFGLQVIRSPAPGIVTEIKLVWHERTHNDPGMGKFREVVAKAFGSGLRA